MCTHSDMSDALKHLGEIEFCQTQITYPQSFDLSDPFAVFLDF